MKQSIAVQQPAMVRSTFDSITERERHLLESSGWYRLGRGLLWAVIAMASIKPAEVLGGGEQIASGARVENGPVDLAFRCAVLLACLCSSLIALAYGRVRAVTLCFVPFLIWSVLVAIGQQSDSVAFRQLASYATWILFFISATALLDRPEDYGAVRIAMVAAVFTSAAAGVLQCVMGYAPMIGFWWQNIGFPRIHTGGGGVLLDALTPYCAALLLLATPVESKIFRIGGILSALWASANILRGGVLGFSVAMAWLLLVLPGRIRMNLIKSAAIAVLLVAVCFGARIVQKCITADDDVNNAYAFNTSGRFEHWPQLVEWIEQEPIWGRGPNADMQLLGNGDGKDLRAAHNELLSTAVNFGLVGTTLLWLPLLALLMCMLRLTGRYRSSNPEALWGAGAVLVMVAVLSLTDNTLRVPGVMILALAPTCVALNRLETIPGAIAYAGNRDDYSARLQRPTVFAGRRAERLGPVV